jgi:hypothetical protein
MCEQIGKVLKIEYSASQFEQTHFGINWNGAKESLAPHGTGLNS